MCGPNLECEELAAVFQKHLQEGRGLHFGEFLNTTCKHLVRGGAGWRGRAGRRDRASLTASLQMRHFPDLLGRLLSTSLFYFKSSWEDVRAAAPMLTGEGAPGSLPTPTWPLTLVPPLAPKSPHWPLTAAPPPQGSWCCTWRLSSGHRWTWSSSSRVSPSPANPAPHSQEPRGPPPPQHAGLH